MFYEAGPRATNYSIIIKVLQVTLDTIFIFSVSVVWLSQPTLNLSFLGCARSGRFRSINEFIPHAIWLFTDTRMDYANCECKYCTKQPQRGITASMGDILGTPSSASPTPRIRRGAAREKTRVSRPYATIQKVLQPAKSLKPSANVLDSPTLAERNSDLRAVFSRNSMKLKRWYRDGEVVWCELRPPIPGPTGEESSILFWPGLVQEYKLKAVAIPREAEAGPSDRPKPPTEATPGASSSRAKSNAQEEGRGPVIEKEDIPPFRVEQSTVYHVELFAVNKSIHVSDNQVIPYQAYVSSDALIAALQAIPPQLLDFDRDNVSNFNPCPGDTPPSFVEAGAPYAIAVQIASNLSEYFSVTDEWQFSYTLPPPPPPPSASQNQNDNSLHAVITAANRINSSTTALTTISNNSPQPFQNISSTQPGMPQSDLDKLANEVFGSPPPAGQVRTQIRFQGLWWGPERIWVDDFVRLKIPRRCLAPNGAQDISPPGGPSKKAREAYQVTGRDPSEIGAGSRGVFMRIDALFVVETVSKDGRKKKECRASGPLYELVDEDWNEDEDVNVKQHQIEMQARLGKSTKSASARASSTPATQLPTALPISASTSTPGSAPQGPAQTQPSSTQPPMKFSILIPPNRLTTPTPAPSHYLPPQPPIGYRFRSVLTPGYEVVISLSLLAGRYYPGLLMHPLLARELHRAAKIPLDDGGILRYGHIWALDGLNGGFHCSVDPEKFLPSRMKMLDRADREAYGQLERHKRYEIQKALGEIDSEGDGDEDVDMLQDKENLSDNEHPGGFPMVQDVGGISAAQDEDVTMH